MAYIWTYLKVCALWRGTAFLAKCHYSYLGDYKRASCLQDCYLKFSKAVCGCIPLAEAKDPTIKFCGGYAMISCLQMAMDSGRLGKTSTKEYSGRNP